MSVQVETRLGGRAGSGRVALAVILGSETVFFLTMLVAYLSMRSAAGWSVTHTLARLTIPLVNTGTLLTSAACAWRSLVSIRMGRPHALSFWLLLTLLLGLVFVAGQVFEFGHAGMQIDDQGLGAIFFTLMGFHALHVLAGVVFLVLNLARARLRDFSSDNYAAVELGTWFWFYVSVVWIALFAALYLL